MGDVIKTLAAIVILFGPIFSGGVAAASCTCVYPSGTYTNQASCPDPRTWTTIAPVDCNVTTAYACDPDTCTGADCVSNQISCATGGGANAMRTQYTCGPGQSVTPSEALITSTCGVPASPIPVACTGPACPCPAGYDNTVIDAGGTQACRPVVPSLDFYRSGAATAGSGGYPVCGVNRIAIALDYGATNVSGTGTPQSANTVKDALGVDQYFFARGTDGLAPANPVYLYSDPLYKMSRCQCTNPANPVAAQTIAPQGPVTLLSPLVPSAFNPTGARFFPDDYDTVRAQSRTNAGIISHAMVALAKDGVSNGSMGDIYLNGQSFCGCPNLNEKPVRIDNSFSGDVCQSMMDTDTQTAAYAILTTFIPNIHQNGVTSQIFSTPPEPFSVSKPTEYLTKIKLPTVNGGYQQYDRRIWTCAPPTIPKLAGPSKIQCAFPQAQNACDNGSGGGVPSVVSKKWNTATSPSAAFDNVVNKKLACCLNDFNPSDITKSQKFDCVDNSSLYKTYASFDDLWTGKDDDADGGQPTALVLNNSSGQIVTGFYGLDGERCSEFSEFGGQTIQSATVNPMLMSAQQNKISESSGVHLNSYAITPNSSLVAAFGSTGKRIPQTAAEMRRCPVLVRAAMIATCPVPIALPKALVTYPAVATTGVASRCSVASTIEIHLRVEQIYEITGLPVMKKVDTFLEGIHPANVDVMKLVKSKTNGFCPAGSILTADGDCTYQ